MRIGIDIRCLFEQTAGGVATYTEELLKHLFKIDHHNEYLLFYNSFRKQENKFLAGNAKYKLFHFPNKIFNTSLNFLNYPKIDQLIGGVDLFFVPNIIFLSLSHRVKKVITIHDLSFFLYPKLYSLKGRCWHKIVNPKKLIGQFDKIIAVSENTRQDVLNYFGVNPEKVVTIYSGIDYNLYRNDNLSRNEMVRQKYGLPEKFILSLSALEPRKNIEMIISAFNLCKERYPNPYHLVIVGSVRNRIKDLPLLIQKSKFKKDIHFIGPIFLEDKPSLYHLANLFIYPSFYEGFGFPPLEAMASSLPVVTSYTSSLSEVGGEATVMIDPYNIGELAASFQKVLFNPALAEKLKEKGRNQVLKFSWERTARETLNLFENLVF